MHRIRSLIRFLVLLPFAAMAIAALQWQLIGMLLDYRDQIERRGKLVPYAEVSQRMEEFSRYEEIESRIGLHPALQTKQLYPQVGLGHVWLYERGILLMDDWSNVRVTPGTLRLNDDAQKWDLLVKAMKEQFEIRLLMLDQVLLQEDMGAVLNEVKVGLFIYGIRDGAQLYKEDEYYWMNLPPADVVSITRSSYAPTNLQVTTTFYDDELRFNISDQTRAVLVRAILSELVRIDYARAHSLDQLDCYVSSGPWSFTRPFVLVADQSKVYTSTQGSEGTHYVLREAQNGRYVLLKDLADKNLAFRNSISVPAIKLKQKAAE